MTEYTFICYAHENTQFALKLARQLQKQGLAVWLDQWDIPPEAEWDRAIERMVRNCSQFLIVLSPAALNSWVVHEQFLLAMEMGKPITPVLYQPCELPPPLQNIPHIDFTGRGYKSALERLLAQYFPDKKVKPGYGTKLKTHLDNLRQVWLNTLLPLLWPGWLGPSILVALFLIGALFFWPSNKTEFVSLDPGLEALAVVQSTPTPIPLPTPIKTKVRTKDGQVMVAAPAGEFLMGSTEADPEAAEDEMPQRKVYVDAFWIDKTEITNGQYRLCVEAKICAPPKGQTKVFGGDELPVVGINWEQAATYCEWVGGRLPTEAEWEKAARGMDGRLYPWGNKFDGKRLSYCDTNCMADSRDRTVNDGYRFTAPTGAFPAGASPYGVLDMSGNVWEWTADWYDVDAYSNLANNNPTGPEDGLQRVIRGGSWYYHGRNLRVTKRHKDTPTARDNNIGFRCVVVPS